MDDAVREGLICPICHQDLGDVSNLQRHYEEAHSNEDKAGFQALKGFFGKAKRRLLQLGDDKGTASSTVGASQPVNPGRGSAPLPSVDEIHWEPQEFGAWRSHLHGFKRIREDYVKRTVIETNKKIIRLEKLLDGIRSGEADSKADSKKRKAFEQSVVTWKADSSIKSCPLCEKGFGVLRRKHHCRLCGAVICNGCSDFVTLQFAESLTKTAKGASQKAPVGESAEPDPDNDIRACLACFGLLLRRSSRLQDKYSQSLLAQLYNRMMGAMQEVKNLQPRYVAMAESLQAGEQTHSLSTAQDMKHQLIKQFELIDGASKRIFAMVQPVQQQQQQQQGQKGKGRPDASDEPSSDTSPREALLHKHIRVFASQFLQEYMVTLPSLPDAQKLKKLQIERSQAAEDKARRDREAADRAAELRRLERDGRTSAPSSGASSPSSAEPDGSSSVGWQPKVTPLVSAADADQQDPLLLQRDVLRGYIDQARKAKKFDEVRALESSLLDIEEEIARAKKL